MRSYIVLGSAAGRQHYIKKFIKENNIKPYNLFNFDKKVGISDSREIKKILSIKVSEKRLFIFSSDITVEAQNALLKTLEELPIDATIVFSSQEGLGLLPTIFSRSTIISNMEREIQKVPLKLIDDINIFLDRILSEKNRLFSTLAFSDRLTNQEFGFDEIILGLREALIKSAESEKFKRARLILKVLKGLVFYYPMIKSNNFNKRIILEKILFQL